MSSRVFAATAMFLLSLSLAAGLSLPGAGPRPMPDVALARIAGADGDHRGLPANTDCSEAQSNMPGIPMSHCWNYDEVVAGEACFFCTNSTLYPAIHPFGGTGIKYVLNGQNSCVGDRYLGDCGDPDGNGQYRRVPISGFPQGTCTGSLDKYVQQSGPINP
jgi:hypothetical protein